MADYCPLDNNGNGQTVRPYRLTWLLCVFKNHFSVSWFRYTVNSWRSAHTNCALLGGAMTKPAWATLWQNQLNDCVPSEDLDQPGHPPSLIRVFAVRMKKPGVPSYPLSAQRSLIKLGRCPGWSESSQGAPSLCWFCHVAPQMVVCKKRVSIMAICIFFKSISHKVVKLQ